MRRILGILLLGTAAAVPQELQAVDPPVGSPPTNAAAIQRNFPVLPTPPSPVEQFRELLAMGKAERRQVLTNRSPESAQRLLSKLREYDSMRPDERELRLRATELRWYLVPLMHMAPTNRAAQLQMVPAEDRKVIEERLREWDNLDEASRQALLDNEATIAYFTEPQSSSTLTNLSVARREALEKGIRQWRALPEEQRRQLLSSFSRFFELTQAEKTRALARLSEAERREIEKTLRHFGTLSPQQRSECIRSFEKFAGLSLEERQQFLKNAERWKLMSPDERQAWRDLVSRLIPPPPMPPGFDVPLPPRPPTRTGRPPLVTNASSPSGQ